MRKRILALLTALCLCLPLWAGAEEPEPIIWYVDLLGTLYISADGGGSYAELPGLGQSAQEKGLIYYCTTMVEPLPNGGLRVRARDRWAQDFSFERDYSVQEVAAALENAQPTPVRVLSADENGAQGVRVVRFNTGVGVDAGEESWGDSVYQSVTTTDGVTWTVTAQSEPNTIGTWVTRWPAGATALGKYRLTAGGDSGRQIYLSSAELPTEGVLLEEFSQAIQDNRFVYPGALALWYTPEDTVTLAAYDIYDRAAAQGYLVQKTYSAVELDALLGQAQPRFEDIAAGDWFSPGVAACAGWGLMVGVSETAFAPGQTLTAPECLTLALRVYGTQTGRSFQWFPSKAPEDWGTQWGDAWWRDGLYTLELLRDPPKPAFHPTDPGVDWPAMEALAADVPGEGPVTRLTFARALAETAGELERVKTVDALPDLLRTEENAGVYALYEAGVLNGVDDAGSFAPEGTLTRAEAACMAARVVEPSLRVK